MATQRERIAQVCARLCTTVGVTETEAGDAVLEICRILGDKFRTDVNRYIDRINAEQRVQFDHI